MKSFTISTLGIACFLTFASSTVKGPEDHPDYKGVHKALSNCFDGLFQVDLTLIEAIVHPELRKRDY